MTQTPTHAQMVRPAHTETATENDDTQPFNRTPIQLECNQKKEQKISKIKREPLTKRTMIAYVWPDAFVHQEIEKGFYCIGKTETKANTCR